MLKIEYDDKCVTIPSNRVYRSFEDAKLDGYVYYKYIYNAHALNSVNEHVLVTGILMSNATNDMVFVRKTGIFKGRGYINGISYMECIGATREECLLSLSRHAFDKVIIEQI